MNRVQKQNFYKMYPLNRMEDGYLNDNEEM
jgi:hypothetical protein